MGSFFPGRRFNLTYRPWNGGEEMESELPCILLVVGDLKGYPDPDPISCREWIEVDDKTLDRAVSYLNPSLQFSVRNAIDFRFKEKDELAVHIGFSNIKSFHPLDVAEQISEVRELLRYGRALASGKDPAHEHREMEQRVHRLLHSRGKPSDREKTVASTVSLIEQIYETVGRQIDEVLHHPSFQSLEAAWRGLQFLVDRTQFSENISIYLWNCSKKELIKDFESCKDLRESTLNQLINFAEHKPEYCPGRSHFPAPLTAVIADYEFGPSSRDIKLLQCIAKVAAFSCVPFIAGAAPEFFGEKSGFQRLSLMKDLQRHFEEPGYESWRAFRDSEEARFVALTLPRFLLRPPYGPDTQPVETFNYRENVSASHEHYLWGNAAFAFAGNLTKSFARYRWCTNIIGPQGGGEVEDLHLHQFDSGGGLQTKIPTEVHISDRREYELSEQGFMGLTMRKRSDDACFLSANSVQRPKRFDNTKEGRQAELDYKVGLQLCYLFVILRFYQYLVVLQKEMTGIWKTREDLENGFNEWLAQYLYPWSGAYLSNPWLEKVNTVVGPKPLSRGRVWLHELLGRPGWYKVELSITPNFKCMGNYFNLTLHFLVELLPSQYSVSFDSQESHHKIDTFFKLMHENEATHLHIAAGRQPSLRIKSAVEKLEYKKLESDELKELLYGILPKQKIQLLEETGEVRFAYEIPNLGRYRGHLCMQHHGLSATFKTIPYKIRTVEELNLPSVISKLASLPEGLVIVAGPRESGKSTTIVATIAEANQTRKGHIITIEDPIEFVHENKGCIIDQREAGTHTMSLVSGLRDAISQDADIVFVSEIRDPETISLVLDAACSGQLVLTTYCSNLGMPGIIENIVDVFPEHRKQFIRSKLGDVIRAVISQVLFKRIDKSDYCAALEILIGTPAIRALIREGKTFGLGSAIQTGKKFGMQLKDDAIMDFVARGWIDGNDAYSKAADKHRFVHLLKPKPSPSP